MKTKFLPLILACALIFSALPLATSSRVYAHSMMALTISGTTIKGWAYGSAGVITLRFFADQDFSTSTGEIIKAGNSKLGTGFYRSFTCTVLGTVLTIPAITEIPTTTDSPDFPDARWTARFYQGNTARDYWIAGFNIRHTYGASQLWSTIWNYNNPPGVQPQPTGITGDQAALLINQSLGSLNYANVATAGRIETSVAPADASHPIAVEDGDPRVAAASTTNRGTVTTSTSSSQVVSKNDYASTTNRGVGKTSVAPASAIDPIFVEDTDPRVNEDYNASSFNSLAVAVAAMPSGGATLTVNTSMSAAGVTVPSYVQLKMTGRAQLTGSGTVTIVGDFDAPKNKRVFGSGLTVSFAGNTALTRVYPEWWGAVADGTTDNRASFQACFSSAQNIAPVQLSDGTYLVNIPANSEQNVLTVTGALTIQGLGSRFSRIKIGPEAPTNTNTYIRFINLSSGGGDFWMKDLFIQGQADDSDKTIFAVYQNAGDTGNTIRLTNVVMNPVSAAIFLNNSTSLASGVHLLLENCDIHRITDGVDNNLAFVGGFNHTVIYGGSYTTVTPGGVTAGHCFYLNSDGNVDIDGATIGPGVAYGIQIYGGSAGTGEQHASVRNTTFNGPFTNGAGLLTSDAVLTEVVNCNFNNGNGLRFQNAPVSVIGGRFYEAVADGTVGATAKVNLRGVTFVKSAYYANTATDATLRDCTFNGVRTSGINSNKIIDMVASGASVRIEDSQFNGGNATYGQIFQQDGSLIINRNMFVTSAVIYGVRHADSILLGGGNQFTDTAQIGGGSSTLTNYDLKVGVAPSQVAASVLSLDLNFDTYPLSGTGTVNTFYFNLGGGGLLYPRRVKVIALATLTFGSGGNIKAAAGAVTADRVYTFVYEPVTGFYYQEH